MVYSINNFFGKEEQLKTAFRKVLEKLVEDKKEGNLCYGYGRFYEERICVASIIRQAQDHLFDDKYKLFDISSNDGNVIRDYSQTVSLETAINDFYLEFPEMLDGEPEFILRTLNKGQLSCSLLK